MGEKTRFTIRMEQDLRDKMKRMDVNWSEYLRNAIEERIGEDKRRTIQNLVDEYQGDIPKLWTLYMFSYGTRKHWVYETAELVLDDLVSENTDNTVNQVREDMEGRGLTSMYEEIKGAEVRVGETIRLEIEERTTNSLQELVSQNIKDASETTQTGIRTLALFIWNDLEDERVYVIPNGVEKTWELAVDDEVEIDDLVETGVLFKDHYSSNAYSHGRYWVPDYALQVFEQVIEQPSDFGMEPIGVDSEELKNTFQRDNVQEFIDWMDGRRKSVKTYNHDEEIEEAIANLDVKDLDQFKELRKELVKKGIIIIDYRPHRSSTGGRSSLPSRWSYRFSEPAMEAPIGMELLLKA